MNKNYFVISTSEDGDASIHTYSEDELNETLNEEGGINPAEVRRMEPNWTDLLQDSGYYIIEGRLVVPKEKTQVTRWEIE